MENRLSSFIDRWVSKILPCLDKVYHLTKSEQREVQAIHFQYPPIRNSNQRKQL